MKSTWRLLAGIVLTGLLSLAANPAAAQTYKIYFNHQIKILTREADETVAVIAQKAIADSATQIVLVGHADTSEKNAQALSLGRAKAVKAALLRHKLPKTVKVTVSGVGATQLDIPTAPNESEPLNRNVVVTVN